MKDNFVGSNIFRVRVKSGSSEIEIEIPLSPRNEIGLDENGTGKRAIIIVGELIEKIKKI